MATTLNYNNSKGTLKNVIYNNQTVNLLNLNQKPHDIDQTIDMVRYQAQPGYAYKNRLPVNIPIPQKYSTWKWETIVPKSALTKNEQVVNGIFSCVLFGQSPSVTLTLRLTSPLIKTVWARPFNLALVEDSSYVYDIWVKRLSSHQPGASIQSYLYPENDIIYWGDELSIEATCAVEGWEPDYESIGANTEGYITVIGNIEGAIGIKEPPPKPSLILGSLDIDIWSYTQGRGHRYIDVTVKNRNDVDVHADVYFYDNTSESHGAVADGSVGIDIPRNSSKIASHTFFSGATLVPVCVKVVFSATGYSQTENENYTADWVGI